MDTKNVELGKPSVDETALAVALPSVLVNKFVGMPGPIGLRLAFIDEPGGVAPSSPRASVMIPWPEVVTLKAILEHSLAMLEEHKND